MGANRVEHRVRWLAGLWEIPEGWMRSLLRQRRHFERVMGWTGVGAGWG